MKKTNIFGLVLILSTLLIGCAQPNMCADIPEVYTITAAETTNGTISLSKTTAAAGETITVTATPDSGYSLASISASENITLTGDGNEKTFTMPTSNVTITATFVQLYTIRAVVPDGITVNKTEAVAGEEVTVTLGGTFQSIITGVIVKKGNQDITVTNNKFIMPEGNVEITVGFNLEDYDYDVKYYFRNGSEIMFTGTHRFLSNLGFNSYKDIFTSPIFVSVSDNDFDSATYEQDSLYGEEYIPVIISLESNGNVNYIRVDVTKK